MKKQHFDENELRAVIAKHIEAIEPLTKRPGQVGAQARLHQAAVEPLHIQILREMNAGTDNGDILIAVANLASNLFQSVVETLAENDEERFALMAFTLEKLGEGLSGEAKTVAKHFASINPVQSGTA